MIPITIAQICKILDIKATKSDAFIEEINIDTRQINLNKNTLFVALKVTRDGHDFIEKGYAKGVRFFIVSKEYKPKVSATFLAVENPLRALQKITKWYKNKFSVSTIAITGSNGKTIVKEWLWECLKNKYVVTKSPKSYNSQIGVPLSVLGLNLKSEIGIFEVGISEENEMEFLEAILNPNIGVFTHFGLAHATHFLTKKTHLNEKLKLFKNVKTLVYNSSDSFVDKTIKESFYSKDLISFGTNKNAAVYYQYPFNNKEDLCLYFKGIDYVFTPKFKDKAYLENLVAVATLLTLFESDFNKIITLISELKAIPMRLEIIKGVNDCTIVNDTYNSDLQSIQIGLQLLEQQLEPHKVLIVSDLDKISTKKDQLYTELIQLIKNYPIDQIFTVGTDTKTYLKNLRLKAFDTTKNLESYLLKNPLKKAAILLKGSRKFEFEKLLKPLQYRVNDTILEINLSNLRHNYNWHKNRLNSDTKIMVMVKAFGYGNGGKEVAQVLENQNVNYLGVAFADEGIQLRKEGIKTPIIVMNPEINSYSKIIQYDLEPEIYSIRQFQNFLNILKQNSYKTPYPIHLKLDTGMHRLGFSSESIKDLKELLIKNNSFIYVQSIFSHLVASDNLNEKQFTLNQINLFLKNYEKITGILNYKPMRHILNSSGIVNYPGFEFEMVRLGIGLYGFCSDKNLERELKNVGRLKSVISQINTIDINETVGYNNRFKSTEKMKTATIPIGYADGIHRELSNGKLSVKINKKTAKTVGNICMDMLMVDVSTIDCKEGDEVIFYEAQEEINTIAKSCNTINYEILTAIDQRVKRIFYED